MEPFYCAARQTAKPCCAGGTDLLKKLTSDSLLAFYERLSPQKAGVFTELAMEKSGYLIR